MKLEQRDDSSEASAPHAGSLDATRLQEAEVILIKRNGNRNEVLVPLAGIEPALLAELDFESSASTSSATGAFVEREGCRWKTSPLPREAGGL